MTTFHHDARSNRFRWLAACVAVFVSLIATPSFAATVAAVHYYAAQYGAGGTLTVGTDALVQCNNLYAGRLAAGLPTLNGTITVSGLSCSKGAQLFGGLGEYWECPSGSGNLDNATKLCTVTSCVAGPAGFHRGVVAGEKVNPFNTCHENCLTLAVPRLDLGISVTTGSPVQTYATWELVRKAESCDPATSGLPTLPSAGTTPTPPTPEPECPTGQRRVYFASGVPSCAPIPEDRFCPPGYTYGTVNGKDTCISQSSGPPTSTSPTSTDKTPATESKESSTTTTNPDGSTTTTTTKSDGRGGGSVTTTTKSADGKTIESTTKQMGDKPDGKCEPGTVGCMQPGTPSGAGPVKSDRTVVLGTGVGLSGFSAECPADKTYQTQFTEIRLSYSKACELAAWIKPLVLLAAAIVAGLIVIQSLRS